MEPIQRVGRSKCFIINTSDDAKTVIVDKTERPRLTKDSNIIFMNRTANEIVGDWLKTNSKWQDQPVWNPKEHPGPTKKVVVLTSKDMGNDKDHPMEIEDTIYIIDKEVVTDQGILRIQYLWNELTEEEKDKYLIKWMGKDYKEFL